LRLNGPAEAYRLEAEDMRRRYWEVRDRNDKLPRLEIAFILPSVEITGACPPWRRCQSCGTDCGPRSMAIVKQSSVTLEGLCPGCSKMLSQALRKT
jgi:hypothetical protein